MTMWRENRCILLYLFLFALLDSALMTSLHAHGRQFRRYFGWEIEHYDFKVSLFSLWVCALLRTVLILGSLVGVLYNRTSGSTKRLQGIKPAVVILAVFMWAFPIVKLLYISEYRPSELSDIWFWLEFGWAVLAAIIFYGNFCLLCGVKVPDIRDSPTSPRLNVNSADEEQRPLLGEHRVSEAEEEEEKDEENKEQDKQKKSVTVWRLLSYSKPDIPYLAVAFVFMQINAAGRCYFSIL